MKKVDDANSRLSLPGKIVTLLLNDDQFYREVSSSKRVSLPNFPKYDQWSDDDGFNMEFALAGFSGSDISVSFCGYMLTVQSIKHIDSPFEELQAVVRSDEAPDEQDDDLGEEYSREVLPKMTRGVIVRGIARRAFKVDFFISSMFDLNNLDATMANGLLKISIPKSKLYGKIDVLVKD
jgi:HSP20 family molecular chaperone IbpA